MGIAVGPGEVPDDPSFDQTLTADGQILLDPVWDRSVRKWEKPPFGVWHSVVVAKHFRPTTPQSAAVATAVGGLLMSVSLARPGLWYLFAALGVILGSSAYALLWIEYGRPTKEDPGESFLWLPASPDMQAKLQGAVARAASSLGWNIADERPLDIRRSYGAGRRWEFEGGLSLTYYISGGGRDHVLVAVAKQSTDAERFRLLKGWLVVAIQGPQTAASGAQAPKRASAVGAATTTRITFRRDPAPVPMAAAPAWALTIGATAHVPLADATAPPGRPEGLPAGWWASTARGRDIYGSRRPSATAIGTVFGVLMAALLPLAAGPLLKDPMGRVDGGKYAMALAVLLPFAIPTMIWYSKRGLGTTAICYLRIPPSEKSFETLRVAIDAVIRESLPELAPSSRPNAQGLEWADVAGETSVFLWRTKGGGDPMLEIRSDAKPERVVAFKGVVSRALFTEDRVA